MAQLLQSWGDVTLQALSNLWIQVLGVIPMILGALIIFVVGLIVASVLDMIVIKVVRLIKLDNLLMRSGLEEYLKRGGWKLDTGKFLGKIVYWFVVIAFVLAASDILKFYAFSGFLSSILNYIPNIIIAVLISLTAFIIAGFLKSIVKVSVAGARFEVAHFLGALAWWTVVVFGSLAALAQLGIASSLFNIIISGLVAMFALAGGIAFGLGGKDYASHLLNKMKDEIEHKR
ncbi:MAG: hypothetical protein Q8N22_00710 [bacterium]|nr:hypothetical protein [bacterium]